jgi:hypothetical protein
MLGGWMELEKHAAKLGKKVLTNVEGEQHL